MAKDNPRRRRFHLLLCARIRRANHPAGDASAGVANRLPSIVGFGVNNHRPAQNRVLVPRDRHIVNRQFKVRFAAAVGLQVPQVARVALVFSWQPMLVLLGIVMTASAAGIRRRTIPEFVYMDRMFLVRHEPFHVGHNFHSVPLLREAYRPVRFIPLCGVQDGDGLFDLRIGRLNGHWQAEAKDSRDRE